MAKNSAQAQTEKPEAQKGGATKMPIFLTKFDGSGSDNTDEFRRTLSGHLGSSSRASPEAFTRRSSKASSPAHRNASSTTSRARTTPRPSRQL